MAKVKVIGGGDNVRTAMRAPGSLNEKLGWLGSEHKGSYHQA